MCNFCWLGQPGCSFVLDSGWVQAIFSVVAIVYAYASGKKSEWQREANAQKLLDVYLASIDNENAGMVSEIKLGNAPAINRAADRMINAVDRSRYIDHSVLPYATVVALSGIEDHVQQLAQSAKVVIHGFNQEIFSTQLNRNQEAIREAMAIIKEGRHPKKWWHW